jgi:hypothetical protein
MGDEDAKINKQMGPFCCQMPAWSTKPWPFLFSFFLVVKSSVDQIL